VFFWLIFITLMLPVEVRILPTYDVVASLGMLNSYSGLIIPLIASATATFLFRQFFLTIPDELWRPRASTGRGQFGSSLTSCCRLAKPTSRRSSSSSSSIGWNQYLWPFLITTDRTFTRSSWASSVW
jgi:sn-glycerol 3-phosphate transport system permease protein